MINLLSCAEWAGVPCQVVINRSILVFSVFRLGRSTMASGPGAMHRTDPGLGLFVLRLFG
jgi:hypothetical protein